MFIGKPNWKITDLGDMFQFVWAWIHLIFTPDISWVGCHCSGAVIKMTSWASDLLKTSSPSGQAWLTPFSSAAQSQRKITFNQRAFHFCLASQQAKDQTRNKTEIILLGRPRPVVPIRSSQLGCIDATGCYPKNTKLCPLISQIIIWHLVVKWYKTNYEMIPK